MKPAKWTRPVNFFAMKLPSRISMRLQGKEKTKSCLNQHPTKGGCNILLWSEHIHEINFKFTVEDIHRDFIIACIDANKLKFPIFA